MSDRLHITPGETLDVLARTPEALVLEATYAPGGSAPPAHYHPAQDEHFEVRAGTLRVEVSGVERDLDAGETLDIPRGTSHRMWNPHAQPARSHWETRPAGRTEDWFAALASLQGTDHVDASGTPKVLPFAALTREFDDTFRLAARPASAGRLAVAALAGIARVTGRAPQARARDLGALAGPLAGIAFVAGLTTGLALADAPFPQPGAKPTAIRRFFQDNANAARINIVGQLLSAAWLARFAAWVAALARDSGPGDSKLATVTAASGGLSSASLAASAMMSLALTSRAGRKDATAVTLHRRMFVAGGPVHTTAFGVYVACLSIVGRRSRRLPRPLTAAGLASASAGVMSPLSLVRKPAVLLIPAARISGLVICGIAGARLSGSKARGGSEDL
jgi:mannose-6-phosphate isomerase-like protein (cupin superfamily)